MIVCLFTYVCVVFNVLFYVVAKQQGSLECVRVQDLAKAYNRALR